MRSSKNNTKKKKKTSLPPKAKSSINDLAIDYGIIIFIVKFLLTIVLIQIYQILTEQRQDDQTQKHQHQETNPTTPRKTKSWPRAPSRQNEKKQPQKFEVKKGTYLSQNITNQDDEATNLSRRWHIDRPNKLHRMREWVSQSSGLAGFQTVRVWFGVREEKNKKIKTNK